MEDLKYPILCSEAANPEERFVVEQIAPHILNVMMQPCYIFEKLIFRKNNVPIAPISLLKKPLSLKIFVMLKKNHKFKAPLIHGLEFDLVWV